MYRTPHAAQQHTQHAPGPNLIRTLRQQQLMQERSTASGLAGEASGRGLAGEASAPVLACTTGPGLTASTSHWPILPCAEESSWLSAECSKLSAAAGLGTEHSSSRCQRRAALPAANRAMLERQVSSFKPTGRTALYDNSPRLQQVRCHLVTAAQVKPCGTSLQWWAVQCTLHPTRIRSVTVWLWY
jgi:hypothetical protein